MWYIDDMDTVQILSTLLVALTTGPGGLYIIYKGYEDNDGEMIWYGVIVLLIFIATVYYLVRNH